jgi:hypothetical protein
MLSNPNIFNYTGPMDAFQKVLIYTVVRSAITERCIECGVMRILPNRLPQVSFGANHYPCKPLFPPHLRSS